MARKISKDTAAILDPGLECLDSAALHRRIERPRLRRQLAYVLAHSPFYRRKFKSVGRDAEAWFQRFPELPFTDKSEILTDQAAHPPYGSNLCVAPREIRRVHKTSGTTARPLLIAMTAPDITATVASGARAFRAAGLKPGHTVVHCLNYCMWMGGYTDHQSLEAAGAAVVPYGVGNTRALLDVIRDLRANAIHCTPSYLTILEDVLRRELGMEPRKLGLKLGLFGGEAGLETPGFRKNLETVWGMKAMNANYGMADVLSLFGSECSKRAGLHFMGQGNILAELVDPKTLNPVTIDEGAEGELVLTNLLREAQPMVRFRTKDMVRILGDGLCACGRSSFRFHVTGRSDDMLVVRGVNVFPTAVRGVLMNFLQELTGQYQIVLESPPPLQSIVVRAEHRAAEGATGADGLHNRLLEKFRTQMNISPKIEFVPAGSLPRTEGKTKLCVKSYSNP